MTKPLAKKKTVVKPVVKTPVAKPAVKTVKVVEVKKPEKVVRPVDTSEGKEHEHF